MWWLIGSFGYLSAAIIIGSILAADNVKDNKKRNKHKDQDSKRFGTLQTLRESDGNTIMKTLKGLFVLGIILLLGCDNNSQAIPDSVVAKNGLVDIVSSGHTYYVNPSSISYYVNSDGICIHTGDWNINVHNIDTEQLAQKMNEALKQQRDYHNDR